MRTNKIKSLSEENNIQKKKKDVNYERAEYKRSDGICRK